LNFTTVRRSEAELRTLTAECFTVNVTDRFGDYGLTGVMIMETGASELTVDTFLLSCRVLAGASSTA